ncbi:MAG: IclR family transcriptional regulator [Sodalis sp. (in: enterobacteria)]|uniref:IclR family transcriptional regulator n=1 Tax=Sodalis sp. (in: enterobacteria) TaxID=1898979 RepID=UPI003F3AAECB
MKKKHPMKNTLSLYASSRARRTLRILKAMKGHHNNNGLFNKALADLVNDSPANISRTPPFLMEKGMVEQCSNGYYKLGKQLLQIALAYFDEVNRAQIKMAEKRGRCLASPSKL